MALHDFKVSRLKIVGPLLMLNLSPTLLAQNHQIKFEHISPEQVLSQGYILCFMEDRQGFIWFGMEDGLNKFDGYRFTIYKHDVLDSTSISNNYIRSIYEDRLGALWIGTEGGLNRFDRDKEQFTRFINDPKNPHSISYNDIQLIYEDHAGTLWIGTYWGLNRFDRDKEQFTRFIKDPKNPHSISHTGPYSIYEDRASTLWIGTRGGGLNRFDRDKEQFTRFVNDPNNPQSISSNDICRIYEDRVGTLWIGTDGGLNRFDRDKEQFTHFVHDPKNPQSISDKEVISIYEDHLGTLWIGTRGGGLNRFDRDKEQFTHFVHDPKNPQSISNNFVLSIREDRVGTLWIETSGHGLNKFDREKEQFTCFINDPINDPKNLYSSGGQIIPSFYEDHAGTIWTGNYDGLNKFDRDKEQFTHFVHDPKNPQSISDNEVKSIYEDHTGTLWIGTYRGLNRIDPDKEEFTHFVHDPKNPQSISGNAVISIYEDHFGTIWIGTFGGGLNKLDRDKEQFTHFVHDPKNPQSIRNNTIYSIREDSAGTLWIGTKWGLNTFDREKEQFTHFLHNQKTPSSISYGAIYSIYVDRAGTLWIGTNSGLIEFDREKEQFTPVVYDPKNPLGRGDPGVLSIYEDHSRTLWIGTGHGLFQMNRNDRNTKQFRSYTEKDGLPNNLIYGILEDDHGRLWLSTNKGLSRFDPKTKFFRNYDVTDGLQGEEFYGGAYFKNRRGEMFFGGIKGFNMFHPDSIKDNPYIPPVVITSFKRYNTDEAKGIAIEEKGISQKKEIELSYKNNILAFEFAALGYRNTFKNQYAYKLEGYSEKWIQLGTERRVNFTNLDPGTYILRVRGSNNDGVWNQEGTSLKIIITPPWWKTWWAYALYVMIGLGLLIVGRRYELSRVRLRYQFQLEHDQAERLAEIDRMKSRFFANISHEFRTPLTLILGPLESLLQQASSLDLREQYQIMLRNGHRLLLLINQLLDLTKLEASSMTLRARPENIADLLRVIIASFQSLAEHKGIALHLQLPESAALENSTTYLDRDKFEKIISNLVANAIKFTPRGGSVEVAVGNGTGGASSMNETAAAKDNRVTISVRDTGIGIPANELDKIFDRFYQIEHHHQHHTQGTGIGLALTKELVQLHGGEIHVQSEVGKGSTFVVRLPVGKEHLKPEDIIDELAEEEAASALHQNADLQPATARTVVEKESVDDATVLIVEDNPDMRAYLRDILGQRYRLMETGDGEEGLQQAAAAVPDLIVSDVMMPTMDGFAFCEKIKTDERTSHIPVILLTARASGESKIEGLKTGADDYLTKPFNAKELQVRVKNLIEQRQKLRERFSREVTLQPHDIAITTYDERFLRRAMEIVDEHIADSDYDTETFAKHMGMSRMQLNRKLRALTDQSTGEFIRTLRLKRAAQLLTKKSGTTIVEIAYEVGFSSPAHFAKCFRDQFGLAPSEYVRRAEKEGLSS